MNWSLLISSILTQLPIVVHAVESVAGDKTAGSTKLAMAQDVVKTIATDEASTLTGNNATLSNLAASSVLLVLNATDAINKAVSKARGTPSFTAATASGNALVAAVNAASATQASSTVGAVVETAQTDTKAQ